MAYWHRAGLIVLAAAVSVLAAWPALAVDEVFLWDGSRLRGDLEDTGLTLTTPDATHRVSRGRVWRLELGSGAVGDSVEFRDGTRLSGQLNRPRYTLRLAGGRSRTLEREEIRTIVLGAPRSAGGMRVPDVMILANGDHVFGEAMGEYPLRVSTGTHRFSRAELRQITLDAASGDVLELVNGTIVSGNLERARLEMRTPDGQVVAVARNDVKAVVLAPPPRPRAMAAPTTAAVTPPTAPAAAPPTAVAPAALPPAVRAVLRDIHFEFDRWELTPQARATLEQLATAMKEFPRLRLLIEGHADERGTVEYNLALGSRRAQSARDYLASLGVEPERLEMISYGEERPVDPGHNEMAWAINRRAHFAVRAP
jgi:peptidoglycan-associated lipoprotein